MPITAPTRKAVTFDSINPATASPERYNGGTEIVTKIKSPPSAVKNIGELILWKYAKLITRAAYPISLNYPHYYEQNWGTRLSYEIETFRNQHVVVALRRHIIDNDPNLQFITDDVI
jgi:hypothetical protein